MLFHSRKLLSLALSHFAVFSLSCYFLCVKIMGKKLEFLIFIYNHNNKNNDNKNIKAEIG